MAKQELFGKTLPELQEWTQEHKLPRYTASQIAGWLYTRDIHSIDQMLNLSKATRNLLNENFDLGIAGPAMVSVSSDGTKKYLFPADQGKFVEAAYIPEFDRATLCVSTQVGCKMGCLFCMTGKQGFQGNLSPGAILNQVKSLPEAGKLTNIVYMGMGEPLDNLNNVLVSLRILSAEWGFAMSPRRVTVSTIGLLPALSRFIEESDAHLAVSLHSPFEEERKRLMPVENVIPLEKIIQTIRKYDFGKQRRISFEYIMFRGLNDTTKHINRLAVLLNGIRCRVNLIRFHPVPGVPLLPSAEDTLEKFMVGLNDKGIRTTIRASRGQDISAACGMLSTRKNL
ncbi:MAG: 23S rRNA (adenine(2503)-C(2))-methyltransferase RlmN [Bacteroidales bacterium]|nr:23S rRNA (adenine(2503)-C(2))-methyltransferase RlmN [Bacteroidales bacterium]